MYQRGAGDRNLRDRRRQAVAIRRAIGSTVSTPVPDAQRGVRLAIAAVAIAALMMSYRASRTSERDETCLRPLSDDAAICWSARLRSRRAASARAGVANCGTRRSGTPAFHRPCGERRGFHWDATCLMSSEQLAVRSQTTRAWQLPVRWYIAYEGYIALKSAMYRLQLLVSMACMPFAIGCTEPEAQLPAEAPEGAQQVSIQLLHADDYASGFDERARLVVRDDARWASAWQQTTGEAEAAPSIPDVDFRTELVLIAAMGMQSTTGYLIEIDEVKLLDGNAWVLVTESSPGPGCVTADFMTKPVSVVAVPRYEGQTTFVERTAVIDCP